MGCSARTERSASANRWSGRCAPARTWSGSSPPVLACLPELLVAAGIAPDRVCSLA